MCRNCRHTKIDEKQWVSNQDQLVVQLAGYREILDSANVAVVLAARLVQYDAHPFAGRKWRQADEGDGAAHLFLNHLDTGAQF